MSLKTGLSERLKQLRKQKQLTQADLGNVIGIGQTAIANYENGKRFPDEKNLVKIADFFDVSLDELIGRDLRSDTAESELITGFSYSPSDLGTITEDFIKRSQQSDTEAVKLIIDLLKKGYTEEQIMLDLLEASLVRVGELWAEGRYNEAMEHQLSMTVVQSIITMKAVSASGARPRGRFAALTAAGELHNIGLRMICRILEIDGWQSFFLGASVPARSLQEFIASNNIDLLLVSATINENADALCLMITAAKSVESPPLVLAGGRAVDLNRERILDSGADHVFNSIADTIEITRSMSRS